MYPDDCLIDFDLQLIDLFREMDRKHTKVKDLIREEYLKDIVKMPAFARQMGDIIDYRTMDYYQRRYQEK